MLRKYIAPVTVLVMTLGICGVGFMMFGPWMQEQYSIDKCMDNGGKWNFDQRVCSNVPK